MWDEGTFLGKWWWIGGRESNWCFLPLKLFSILLLKPLILIKNVDANVSRIEQVVVLDSTDRYENTVECGFVCSHAPKTMLAFPSYPYPRNPLAAFDPQVAYLSPIFACTRRCSACSSLHTCTDFMSISILIKIQGRYSVTWCSRFVDPQGFIGCGKRTVIRHAARHLGLHVVEYSCHSFMISSEKKTSIALAEAFDTAGESEKNVRDIFQKVFEGVFKLKDYSLGHQTDHAKVIWALMKKTVTHTG
ncbi:hypothetical protein OROMI_015682 [Orobanche minor]